MNRMSDLTTETVTKLKPKNSRAVLMLSIPLLIAAIGLYFWLTSGGSVSTDNAAVKQDIVSVSAQGKRPGGRRRGQERR
jgi:membrane fusion protein (multidrug efflux system)